MSAEKKSTHVRLDPEIDKMLSVLAEHADKDKAELLSIIATKTIVGEFHGLKVAADRIARLGIGGIRGDSAKFCAKRRGS